RVALGDRAGTLRIWDAHTGEAQTRPLLHDGAVRAVAFTPKGDLLASASADRTAHLWQVSGQSTSPSLRHEKPLTDLVFSPDGRAVLTTDEGGEARLWQVEEGKPMQM